MIKKIIIIVVSIAILVVGGIFLFKYVNISSTLGILKEQNFKNVSGDVYSQEKGKRYFTVVNKDEFHYSINNDFDINYDIKFLNEVQDKFDISKYTEIIDTFIKKEYNCGFEVNSNDYRLSFNHIYVDDPKVNNVSYQVIKNEDKDLYGTLTVTYKNDDLNLASDILLLDKLFDKNLSRYEASITRKIHDMIEMNKNSGFFFSMENEELYISYNSNKEGTYTVQYRLMKAKNSDYYSYSSSGINNASLDKDIENIKQIYNIDISPNKEEIYNLLSKTRESKNSELLILDNISLNISLDKDEKFYNLFATIRANKN